MINYTTGNLLQSNVEALVNTVNTVGVMGKGIALQFKEKFAENYKLYKKAAENKEILVGKVFIVPTHRMDGIKWIINFPTKKHWRNPSKLEYIETGLDDLAEQMKRLKIKSIALPPLGCGNGGLNWDIVKPIIEQKLSSLTDVEINVFEPSDIAYQQKEKKQRAKPKLTPTRAVILFLMQSYAKLGYSLTVLESQKLVYFLQRLGDEEVNKIQFQKHQYGPYAAVLNHILYDMDGYYLSGMKFKDVKTFDELTVLPDSYQEVKEFIDIAATDTQKKRLSNLLALIEGFETPLCMELLSTVDFVIKYEAENKSSLPEIIQKVQSWNDRKKNIMTDEFIKIAFDRLKAFEGLH